MPVEVLGYLFNKHPNRPHGYDLSLLELQVLVNQPLQKSIFYPLKLSLRIIAEHWFRMMKTINVLPVKPLNYCILLPGSD
jgi:hypothetical protein